jgi:hypothetical protein
MKIMINMLGVIFWREKEWVKDFSSTPVAVEQSKLTSCGLKKVRP